MTSSVNTETDPLHTVRTIENNLSGRTAGQSATELGLARIQDPGFPAVLQNPQPRRRRGP